LYPPTNGTVERIFLDRPTAVGGRAASKARVGGSLRFMVESGKIVRGESLTKKAADLLLVNGYTVSDGRGKSKIPTAEKIPLI
jgi:hypothetical protein